MSTATILNWILTNKLELIQIYLSVVGLASLIIKLTPTLKDDHVLKQFLKFTGKFLALNKTISPTEQRTANKG